MTPQDLETLARISDAKYRRSRAALDPLLAEEARLRGELARLAGQERAARGTADMSLMRPCGADVAWFAWIDRTRRRLNTDLARVLAQKEPAMARMRREFGRSLVAEALRDEAAEARRLARMRKGAP